MENVESSPVISQRRPSSESVDWSVIDALREFSTKEMDLVRELVSSFEVNVTQQLPEMEKAVRQDDAVTAKFLAHRMRGMCGNIGARRMEFLCERIEQIAKGGVTSGAVELVDDLRTEFARVRAALSGSGTSEDADGS
jgi:HPt (histidine-containing phosphotransfer) domain-containing protein